MREEFLRNIINATGVNFQFTLGDEFKPIFTMLYEAVKHVDEGVATKIYAAGIARANCLYLNPGTFNCF